MKRLVKVAAQVVVWAAIYLCTVAYFLGWWTKRLFGPMTVDQALFNLQGAGAPGGGGRTLLLDAVWSVLLVSLILVSSLWMLIRLTSRMLNKRLGSSGTLVASLAPVIAVLLVGATGFWSLDSAFGISSHIGREDSAHDITDFYALPVFEPTEEDARTSLVLIYLESIEDAFSSEEQFGTNMLAGIEGATGEFETVPRLYQYPGGGWTMSGIVSTQCGIPLRMPPSSGVESTDTTDQARSANRISPDSYLPGATCLGDVLSQHGYRNVFLGGAKADFAAKAQFFEEHGYEKVLGRDHWIAEGETELTEEWGLSDRRLFENAKIELEELESAGEPFSLTLLTLDTHEPAHRFDYCAAEAANPLTDVTRCSMDLVGDFLQFMEDKGYLDTTAVAVVGDHLKFESVSSSYFGELRSIPDRTTFNRFWTPGGKTFAVEEIDQLSVFPTLLESLGFVLQDGRAALGVSAYTAETPPNSIRELEQEEYEALIRSRSAHFYADLWSATSDL